MPQEELIDKYVDRSSFRADTDFILSNLKEVLEAYKTLSGTKINVSGAKTTAGLASEANNLNKEKAQAIILNERLSRSELNNAKAAKEHALAQKALAQARKENATAAEKEGKAQQAGQRTAKENLKLIDQATNDYLILNRAYRDAALKAKGYFVTLGEGHPVTQQAVKDANDMLVILNKAENAVGQYARQANNSRAKFDGLAQSFAQVSRELPSLTISTQQFALAISNNLPMVADELAKARKEIAALKAEGKEAPSLLSRIGSAILSWRVGLSVGITLLTLYGDKIADWVSGLFGGKAAIEELEKPMVEFNKTLDRQNDLLDDNIRKINTQTQLRILRAKEAGKTESVLHGITIVGLAKEAVEAEKAARTKIRAVQRYLTIYGLQATNVATTRKAIEFLEARSEKIVSETLKSALKNFEKAEDLRTQIQLVNAERRVAVADAERNKKKYFFDLEIKDEIELQKALSEAESLTGETRAKARNRAFDLERQLLEGQRKLDLANAKDSSEEREHIEREFAFRMVKLKRDLNTDLLVISADAAKRQRDLDAAIAKQHEKDQKEQYEKEIQLLAERSQEFVTARNQEQARDIELLNDNYQKQLAATRGNAKKRKEVEEQYAADRAEIEFRYAKIILANEIQLAKDILAAKEAAGEDVTSERAKLAELEMKYSDLVTNHIVKNEEKQLSAAQKKAAEIEKGLLILKDVYGKVSDFVTGIVGAITDRQKNAIQDQIDQLDAQKQKEIEVVNQTVTNEQDKAAKIATINARAQAKKEELERRQRQLDIQRARFEKAANIGRIVIETALAVVHQLATGDPLTTIPRAIAAGVIGAAQLAVAIAQPIPRFKHGRDGGPATLGIVGDGGKREVIASPDLSQAYLTPATDTLTYLPKHWPVFSDVDSFVDTANRMAVSASLPAAVLTNDNGDLIQTMRSELQGLKAAVLGKREVHFSWDNGELQRAIKNGSTWLRYVQNNV